MRFSVSGAFPAGVADGLKTPREWMDKEERKKKPVRRVNGGWEITNETNFQSGTQIEKVTCADVSKFN